MEIFNHWLFLLINASQQPSNLMLTSITILAEAPLIVVPSILLIMWITNRKSKTIAFNAGLNAVFVLTCNFIISLIWFHNRPFIDHIGITLVQHTADSSFPSDHVTLIASVGIFLYLQETYRKLGIFLLALSLATGWARIFIGVHYPLDILGSYLLSAPLSWIFYKYLSPLFSPLVIFIIKSESTLINCLKATKSKLR